MYTRIEAGRRLTLLPFPGGRPSELAFRLTRASGDSAVFEAPEHDSPKRIVYSRAAAADGAVLVARIDDGKDSTRAMEWSMTGWPAQAYVSPGSAAMGLSDNRRE
jgi:hypothetical protein